jgi:hypothetical protein
LDALTFIGEFQDYAAPKLDTYEQAIYLYCVRHSRLLGKPEAVIGFKSARKAMAFGIGKAGTPMSEAVCYEKLRGLASKGLVTILASERGGTRLRVNLPHEVAGMIPNKVDAAGPTLEELDFFNEPDNRRRILEREGHKCFYCRRAIDEESYVIEHVISRPEGLNTYRNLVAGCRQCNNRKGNTAAEEFLRLLYRDGLLTADEHTRRREQLAALIAGELKPPP